MNIDLINKVTKPLNEFIDKLEPIHKRFVLLRYSQRLSQKNVASQMNKTRRWVRTAEAKIRKMLIKEMKNMHPTI